MSAKSNIVHRADIASDHAKHAAETLASRRARLTDAERNGDAEEIRIARGIVVIGERQLKDMRDVAELYARLTRGETI